eukprot:CAMPEP_0194247990 /NCGR_PEP_ID=MMETSP0158-20130606/17361_1 /TAXON_ID=33649 /ORGANISM="Thalassionema nitzschioides, Strain L26-B" /LENGTH=134 /DNA_ID=CAMNT_0038984153 /DNA_START=33 /DNA_END=434 /DNA_ORIENTATION=-
MRPIIQLKSFFTLPSGRGPGLFNLQSRAFASTSLSEEELKSALQIIAKGNPASWIEVRGGKAIHKSFEFTDFSQAWAFMSRSALLAEKNDHHPEWFNVYNRVDVTLTTHDCGGVSTKDIALAEAMDEYSAHLLP